VADLTRVGARRILATVKHQSDIPARLRSLFSWLLLAALVVVPVWMIVEPHTLFVTRATVSSPDVPTAFDGTRIVYLADIHAGDNMSQAGVRRVVDRVMALKPDLILLGGDYVGAFSGGAQVVYPQLARVHAPLGVFAVLGNHDAREDLAAAIDGLKSAGIHLLDNTSTVVARGASVLRIAGVEDLGTGFPNLLAAGAGAKIGDFAIVLSHNPDALAQQLVYSPGLFDLALSAHTHGGQVTFFGLWAPFVPSRYGNRYRTGWHTIAGTPTLVTDGVGTAGLPLRFFAPPQIHVITLRHGSVASAP
jgi:uncharacterized protein